MLGKTVAAAGLLADIAGVWMLAYEVIWGHGMDKSRIKFGLAFQRSWLAEAEGRLQHGPLKPADQADGGAFLRESIARTKTRIEKLEREERDMEEQLSSKAHI
jgi:hypothetical protein